MAGIRTFTLITLTGSVGAIPAERFGGWIFGVGLLSLTAVLMFAVSHSAGGALLVFWPG